MVAQRLDVANAQHEVWRALRRAMAKIDVVMIHDHLLGQRGQLILFGKQDWLIDAALCVRGDRLSGHDSGSGRWAPLARHQERQARQD
mgnify:CR=1 FL=1